jgi:hypothetical protein
LQPAGYGGSIAFNADGKTQVGVANNGNTSHAVMWRGNAKSAVLLHPASYENSAALSAWDALQVGSVVGGPTGGGAVLWRGSLESMQFLPTPASHTVGDAVAVHGNQAVGRLVGYSAILWDIDEWTYTPLGEDAFAFDTNGINQVGYGGPGFSEHALVWSGTEASRLDLHQFLPGTFSRSIATGIDANGAIVGYAGDIGQEVPVVWTPVPEPTTFAALFLGLGLLALSHGRRHGNRSY